MNSELLSLLLAIIKVVPAAIYCITFELISSTVYTFLITSVYVIRAVTHVVHQRKLYICMDL
jgi:hypothetical protein